MLRWLLPLVAWVVPAMTGRRNPHLVGFEGPAVVVPARVAAVLERYADLTSLRVRTRGVDPEASAVLEALRAAAMSWRASATGSAGDTEAEPGTDSQQWLSTTEAARVIGVSSRAIRMAIARGGIPAQSVGDRYRISREDVEHFRAGRGD
ncbi:excisionase family DNA binding protein [Mumia flava]|uniref:Excisionase family DNA binding protein n=1 Tax=Mumia flava TaxID=1348852 RepID=A0A2M9BKV6_9ACTN|nr:helix-turn-helix domain-containing protein [Mumia flava]PJJ58573.1 excisionase family DNA binding protein [Mumia flava]